MPLDDTTYLHRITIGVNKIINAGKLPHFMLLLLSDPEYGVINYFDNDRTKDIIDLCREWVNTGNKPNKEIWLKTRDAAAYFSTIWGVCHRKTDGEWATGTSIWALQNIPAMKNNHELRNIIKNIHLDYINSLLNEDDELFTWEDYEND